MVSGWALAFFEVKERIKRMLKYFIVPGIEQLVCCTNNDRLAHANRIKFLIKINNIPEAGKQSGLITGCFWTKPFHTNSASTIN
jgi:hypothetical protein